PTLFLGCRAPPEESTAHDGAVSSPAPPESIQEQRRPGRRTSHAIRAAASPKLQDPEPLRSDCPASPPAEPRPDEIAPCTAASASPPGTSRPILGDFRCPQKRGKPIFLSTESFRLRLGLPVSSFNRTSLPRLRLRPCLRLGLRPGLGRKSLVLAFARPAADCSVEPKVSPDRPAALRRRPR